MNDTPYPAGTRVVLTYSDDTSEMGDVGTALANTRPAGARGLDASGKHMICPLATQLVRWDSDGNDWYVPIRNLRPLSDPDAEPVVERQEETA